MLLPRTSQFVSPLLFAICGYLGGVWQKNQSETNSDKKLMIGLAGLSLELALVFSPKKVFSTGFLLSLPQSCIIWLTGCKSLFTSVTVASLFSLDENEE